MTWILITYLLGLFYFTATQAKMVQDNFYFRAAWLWFALIPIKNFIFTLFTAGHMRSPRDLALTEVWSNGFTWLLLGISLLGFINAMVPANAKENEKLNLGDFRGQ